MSRASSEHPVVVVGAGIAGLACARALSGAGVRATVLDKGKTPGGRASTRTFEHGTFDHGARRFDVRRARFGAYVHALESEGIVVPVEGTSGTPTYRAVPNMGALALHLAHGLDVRSRAEVTFVRRDGDAHRIEVTHDGEHESHAARVLVVTAPPEQTRALLRGFALADEPRLASIGSEPCFALVVTFSRVRRAPTALPSPFERAERELGSDRETWVFHTTREFARAHLERSPSEVESELVPLAAAALGADEFPSFALAHRWRYARTHRQEETESLVDPEARLVIAGDYLGDGRIESAYESGLLAADHVLELLRSS
ncbi:MAG: FAD-dependent oxidoreductase [Polyangiaceae bacterium]